MSGSAAVIGFGRFGELLASYLRRSFDVSVYDLGSAASERATRLGYSLATLDGLAAVRYIFLAVPISRIGDISKMIAPYVTAEHIIIDVCSVKVYPVQQMQKYLSHTQIIGTHPMFGPDSAANGLDGLKLALCPISAAEENTKRIEDFWTNLGVEVTKTTPEAHDKDSVYSQAFTYTLARMILEMKLPPVTFTTRSYDRLVEIAAFSANDSDQLFHDMLFYNPYLPDMLAKLDQSIQTTTALAHGIRLEQAASRREE